MEMKEKCLLLLHNQHDKLLILFKISEMLHTTWKSLVVVEAAAPQDE